MNKSGSFVILVSLIVLTVLFTGCINSSNSDANNSDGLKTFGETAGRIDSNSVQGPTNLTTGTSIKNVRALAGMGIIVPTYNPDFNFVPFFISPDTNAEKDSNFGYGSKVYSVKLDANIVYSEIDGEKLMLDVYSPIGAINSPVIMAVHGGGFIFGSKDDINDLTLAKYGYTVVSINYRLAPKSSFPAQIIDLKTAVKWIKANSKKYRYNSNKLAAIGLSAGGHLVNMLALTGGKTEFEGINYKPEYANYDSNVNYLVDFYGPSDFTNENILGTVVGKASITALLGCSPNLRDQCLKDSAEASPAYYVKSKAIPYLIIHGDVDTTVSPQQSGELYQLLKANSTDVTLIIAHGEGHGIPAYDYMGKALKWLDSKMK